MRRRNTKLKLLIGGGIVLFTLFKYYSNGDVNEFTGKKQHGGLYPDQKFQALVDRVGQRLVKSSVAA